MTSTIKEQRKIHSAETSPFYRVFWSDIKYSFKYLFIAKKKKKKWHGVQPIVSAARRYFINSFHTFETLWFVHVYSKQLSYYVLLPTNSVISSNFLSVTNLETITNTAISCRGQRHRLFHNGLSIHHVQMGDLWVHLFQNFMRVNNSTVENYSCIRLVSTRIDWGCRQRSKTRGSL